MVPVGDTLRKIDDMNTMWTLPIGCPATSVFTVIVTTFRVTSQWDHDLHGNQQDIQYFLTQEGHDFAGNSMTWWLTLQPVHNINMMFRTFSQAFTTFRALAMTYICYNTTHRRGYTINQFLENHWHLSTYQ